MLTSPNPPATYVRHAAIPHLAGTETGRQIAEQYFTEMQRLAEGMNGTRVEFDNHTVLLDFPVSASLHIDGVPAPSGGREASFSEDPTSDTAWNSKIWNGYGATGTNAAEVPHLEYNT